MQMLVHMCLNYAYHNYFLQQQKFPPAPIPSKASTLNSSSAATAHLFVLAPPPSTVPLQRFSSTPSAPFHHCLSTRDLVPSRAQVMHPLSRHFQLPWNERIMQCPFYFFFSSSFLFPTFFTHRLESPYHNHFSPTSTSGVTLYLLVG